MQPLLIVLTDGAGNVSIGNLPPQEESYRYAEQIAQIGFRSVVINMEHAAFDQGLAQALAEHLKAPCYSLSELKAESLYNAVKKEMNAGGSTMMIIAGLFIIGYNYSEEKLDGNFE